MTLDEISKLAIDEVSAELEKIENLEQKPVFTITESTAAPSQPKADDAEQNSPERIFLNNLSERIEVLFEGLSEIPKDKVQSRLDLTLKFLEFVLANVQNRLSNLK